MTAIISQALINGFSPDQVVNLLLKKFPQQRRKIEKAMSLGFGADQILKFLTKSEKGGVGNLQEATTLHEDTLQKEDQRRSKVHKTALGAAAIAGSAALPYVAPQLIQKASGMIGSLLPQMPQGPAPTPSPQNQTPGQTIGAQVHAPGGIPNVPNMPSNPTQKAPNVDSKQIIQQMGLEDKIKTMQKAGNGPEQIAAGLEVAMRPEQKKWLQSQTQQPLTEIVNDYLSQEPQQPPVPQQPEIQAPKLIATKHGDIGEIRGEDSSGKLINVDGRVKKYKDDEIIESPLPEKDLADLYEEVLQGIQKKTGEEVSRNVYWSGYDPKTNELMYIPHGGRAYVYDDISEEDVKKLTEVLTQRKSSGENYIGAWTEGTNSPIGAAMHQLIIKLQKERGGKGNEYKSRFETIYDALEVAKKAAKKKHAKRKK